MESTVLTKKRIVGKRDEAECVKIRCCNGGRKQSNVSTTDKTIFQKSLKIQRNLQKFVGMIL